MSVASTTILQGVVRMPDDVLVEDFCVLGEGSGAVPSPADVLTLGHNCVIRTHTVIYTGVTLGDDVQTGHHVLVRRDTVIGDGASIGSGSIVEFAVTIGPRVRLHSGCFVPEHTVLEEGCWLGPRVCITNSRYPAGQRSRASLEPVTVGRGARLGANVTVLPGVAIHPFALVGAGAVVVEDVAEGLVVAGNPARVVGRVEDLRDSDGLVYGLETP